MEEETLARFALSLTRLFFFFVPHCHRLTRDAGNAAALPWKAQQQGKTAYIAERNFIRRAATSDATPALPESHRRLASLGLNTWPVFGSEVLPFHSATVDDTAGC